MAITPMSLIAENAGSFSLRDLITPLFRRKRVLIATFLTSLTLLLLVGIVLIPPPYRSRMDMLVTSKRFDPVVTAEPTTQLPVNSTEVTLEEINSEAALLTSRDVLEKVVYATGLDKHHSFLDAILPKQTESERVERAIRRLAKGITAANKTNTNLIEVSYSSSDPQLAYDVLNDLGKYYLAARIDAARHSGSYEFFTEQTQKYHAALQAAETNLRNFSRKQGLAAPDEERTNLAEQVALTMGQYYTAEQAVAADRARIADDREQIRSMPLRSATVKVSAAADKLLDDLHTQLLAEQTKRDQLAMKYAPSYPLVREANEELEQTRTAIAAAESTHYVTETTDRDPAYELLREDLLKAKSDLASQRAAVNAGKRAVRAMQGQMVSLDQQAIQQQDLERAVKTDESNYLLYLSKQEQERATNALDKTSIGNVELAVPPAVPALPVYSDKVVALLAFFASLIFSLAVAYGADYFDPSFQTPAEVADSLGIPIVISMAKKTA
jgi:uncharacterized protein involved in exopolysaccharide biosynthesis